MCNINKISTIFALQDSAPSLTQIRTWLDEICHSIAMCTLNIVTAIQQELGNDSNVAISVPIYLLGKAKEIFGLTSRVFLVDYDMRVWTHSNDGGVTQMLKPELFELDELDESSKSGDESGLFNNERLYGFRYIV